VALIDLLFIVSSSLSCRVPDPRRHADFLKHDPGLQGQRSRDLRSDFSKDHRKAMPMRVVYLLRPVVEARSTTAGSYWLRQFGNTRAVK
jgi:hypothetical protein